MKNSIRIVLFYIPILIFSCDSKKVVSSEDNKTLTTEISKIKPLSDSLVKSSESLDEPYFGTWVIKKFFIRRISAIGDEEAKTYVGKSILFSQGRFTTPFDTDACIIDSIEKSILPIDEETRSSFNLSAGTFEELKLKCGNNTDYFNILSATQAIFERDGGIYMLVKLQ